MEKSGRYFLMISVDSGGFWKRVLEESGLGFWGSTCNVEDSGCFWIKILGDYRR